MSTNKEQELQNALDSSMLRCAKLHTICENQKSQLAAHAMKPAFENLGHLQIERDLKAQLSACEKLRDEWCAEYTRVRDELAEKDKKLAEQQAAFHVNMLRAWPEKSHDEIANAINNINPPTELQAQLSIAREEGRKEGYRQRNNELAESEPMAWQHDGTDPYQIHHYQAINLWMKVSPKYVEHYTIPLIIRPERIEP